MSDYPLNYDLQNQSAIKQLNVVVKFEGTDTQFSLLQSFKKIRYGEDNILYGDPGLVYGGLIPIPGVVPILSPNSNLTISQKIEPEQGRGSAGTFSLEFVDVKGFMTEFVTPGKSLDEVLGGKLVKIYLGYQNTSYPEDYFVVFRGYVSRITASPTKVILQLTDANLKRRQQCFYLGKSTIYSPQKTFSPSDVNVGTDTITIANHGYTKDTKLTFGSDTSLPGGIDFGAEYFVVNPTTNTFQISIVYGGAPVDITSSGSGTLQVQATKICGSFGYEFDPSAVNTALDKIFIANHGFLQDTPILFESVGVLPGGIIFDQTYYAQVLNPNEFQLSLTPSGLIVDLTSQGVGKQSVFIANAPGASTKIPIASTSDFADQILGPDGTYDAAVRTFIKIDDEYMEYGPGDIAPDGITVSRGSRGTTIAEHEIGADVTNHVELQGNPIDLALKIMLSGWGASWIDNIVVDGFNLTGLVSPLSIQDAIILPDKFNAVEDYGIAPGDFLTITGSALNDGVYTVRGFADLNGYPNKVIFVNETLQNERPTSGLMAVRSQYDTLPNSCGNKLRGYDVDVARFQYIKLNFLFQSINTMRIFQSNPVASKQLIEQELFLPCGAYSVTRFGRLSVTITKPPIVDGRSTIIDNSVVVDPQNITIERALNTRSFFNEVQYQYNVDDEGKFTDTLSVIDSESLSKFDTSSVLPVQARGLHSDLGAEQFISKRGQYLLKRYKDAAIILKIKTNWKASSEIEVGDVVPVYDEGDLHISNFEDGTRDLGAQLFEVWERTLDLKTGTAQLTLATQLGYQISDRFATISPSTLVAIGSTNDRIKIKDSFGEKYPSNEKKKWEGFEGEKVRFHNYDYTYDIEKTFIGFDPGDPNVMIVDPPFSTPPAENTIIDVVDYSEASAGDGQKYKIAFAFIDPTLTVASGASPTQFDVDPGEGAKVFPGLPILVRKPDWSQVSSESSVDSIVGDSVTIDPAIEFTPAAGDKAELIGFIDGGGPYRIL